MTALPHTSGDGGAGREPRAISSSRTDQHQRQMRTERGNSLGTYAPVCVAGNDPQHNRPGNRAGFNGFAPSQTRGAMSRASHCRSAHVFLLPALSRKAGVRPSGHRPHSPAERIRAARGAFPFPRAPDCRPVRAQSLTHKPLHYLASREIQHHSNLSLGLTDLTVSSEPKGLGNVRKAFGELRNV